MSERVKRFIILSILILVGAALDGTIASADQTQIPDKKSSTLDLMGKKLYRGAANTGFGWLEIPGGVQEIGNKYGVGAAATWGVVHGAGRAVQRTAVGLFEVLTFPFALTKDYKPIIEPEFVDLAPKAAPEISSETSPSPSATDLANRAAP